MAQHAILFTYNEIELIAWCFVLLPVSSGTECVAVTEVTLEAVGMQIFFSSGISRKQDDSKYIQFNQLALRVRLQWTVCKVKHMAGVPRNTTLRFFFHHKSLSAVCVCVCVLFFTLPANALSLKKVKTKLTQSYKCTRPFSLFPNSHSHKTIVTMDSI